MKMQIVQGKVHIMKYMSKPLLKGSHKIQKHENLKENGQEALYPSLLQSSASTSSTSYLSAEFSITLQFYNHPK